jgi:hypothetical protein
MLHHLVFEYVSRQIADDLVNIHRGIPDLIILDAMGSTWGSKMPHCRLQ